MYVDLFVHIIAVGIAVSALNAVVYGLVRYIGVLNYPLVRNRWHKLADGRLIRVKHTQHRK